MPFYDQHWRLRWLGAVLAGLAAVLFPLRYLQVAAVWDQLHGWDMQPDYIFAACSILVLTVVAFLLARGASRARDRMQWRTDVLSGVIPAPPRSSHNTPAISTSCQILSGAPAM